VITVKMYGDESADETKSRVFTISGIVGTDDEWADATRCWLRRTKGLPFHGTDLETQDVKHSDRQRHQDNLALYADLTQVLAKSHLSGWAFALDLQDYHAVFPEGTIPDWAYYKCLSDLIGAATRTAKDFNNDPTEADDIRLEFTFDSRIESNGTAGTLYSMMANHPDWRESGVFDTKITFESSRREPRLEMADLLARESMKELDRVITDAPRDKRKSRKALEDTGKFHFVERRKDYWESLKRNVEKPEASELMHEWDRWLDRTGKVQNGRRIYTMQNWILFNAWIDNQVALRKKYDDALSSGRLASESPSEPPKRDEDQS
jgi:hypothetical protein